MTDNGGAVEPSCIFCRIAGGEIPATVVRQGPEFVAFRDIDPKAPTHVLVIPRRHVASVNEFGGEDAEFAGRLLLEGRAVAHDTGIAESGYRLVLNTGAEGGQSVHHVHLHVLGGRPLAWPPG